MLAGLWLVGEVDDHVAIYGSKVAEGLSAFQRRSCLKKEPQHLMRQLFNRCVNAFTTPIGLFMYFVVNVGNSIIP